MLPPGPRAALQLGVQTLRALGMRPTELGQCLSLPTATLKRYAPPVSGDGFVAARHLSQFQQTALTAYWVRGIAQDRPLAPPVPARPFLEVFCPVCLVHPEPVPDAHVDLPPPRTLLGAILTGEAACEAGIRPCTSGAARFAGFVLVCRIPPWPAAVFMTTKIHPTEGWWLRTCSRCDRPIVTEHKGLRRCPLHAHQAA